YGFLADGQGVYVTHALTSGQFGVGCKIIDKPGINVSYNKLLSHASCITVTGNTQKEFSLIAFITSPLAENPLRQIKSELSSVQTQGIPQLFEEHKNAWKSFWMRSMMEFGDDYFDNLWHLTMYYANASQRGNYPGRFINGLWTWNRDVQNWNFYFHWNQQETYWPLNAAGHHDLIDPYLNYRFNSLPHAKADAKELFKADGAFVSDVSERRGYNSLSELDNHTPVAEIALDFWRQYRFTEDKEFLRTRAVPYMIEAAKFFESLFEKGSDGKYHAKNGTGYEGWIKLKDGLTELVYAKTLFSASIDALTEAGVNEPRSEKWKEILNNLAPLPLIKADEKMITKENNILKLMRGTFKGDTSISDEIVSAGFGIKEGKMLTGRIPSDQAPETGMAVYDGIFPTVECSVIFPSGLVGIQHRGSQIFNAITNTLKLYSPDCMGWDPLPITYARLGLVKEFSAILRNWAERWQLYCNGWGHYGPLEGVKSDADHRFRMSLVRDASSSSGEQEKQKILFPTWQFRHMGMESMSVLACAMNEALLQSYDGMIQIAPAAAPNQNARFTLHAVGGFVVSAEIKNGIPSWVCIVSKLGNNCKIHNPWTTAYLSKNGRKVRSFDEKMVEFPTQKDEIFVLVPGENTLATWKTINIHYQQNENVKTDVTGKATLGLPRMF
ncbi:MAG: hypothetical protein M1426_02460, partial [Patescibacteria group bacterium]|nr:hypothetical protein [Patescibacteria group bacterium]